MAPPFTIESLDNLGPTDGGGDDSLWRVVISDPSHEHERFLFAFPDRGGTPTEAEMRERIVARAASFENDRGAVEQFREREAPHPPGHPQRRAILLSSLYQL